MYKLPATLHAREYPQTSVQRFDASRMTAILLLANATALIPDALFPLGKVTTLATLVQIF